MESDLEEKEDLMDRSFDENLKLTDEVKRLENELRLQRERTPTDEVVKLRNELRLAMEAEENSKQAMDEFAMVIKEVAAEANQTKEKLASAEEQIQILKAEAEESLLAWNEKEMEFVKCLKDEEDDKAKLQNENHRLIESLTDLQKQSTKIKEDTEKLKDLFKESFNEAEIAKAQSSELKNCLIENERKLTLFTQENVRLRREYENTDKENVEETKQELVSNDAEELTCLKKDKKPHEVEEEPKKSKKTKIPSGVDEKDQKKSSSKKEHKTSHGTEDKELKKIKKDSSMDKELKGVHAHAKTLAIICFDPRAMLPIPGISSKHKETGDSNDENDNNLTDSIFDLPESPPRQHKHRRHRRTTSLVNDDKSVSSEEFEHEQIPHLDDMEVERAGAHGTKKGVLLRKFGDLWKRKNQGHGQIHHNSQNHNLHHKEVTT